MQCVQKRNKFSSLVFEKKFGKTLKLNKESTTSNFELFVQTFSFIGYPRLENLFNKFEANAQGRHFLRKKCRAVLKTSAYFNKT